MVDVNGRVNVEAQIIDAARRCLILYGSAKLSMKDVAKVAGVSRGTAYNYFPDRATLLRGVEELGFASIADDMDRVMASPTGLDQKVAAAAVRMYAWREAEEAVRVLTEVEVATMIFTRSHEVMKHLSAVVRKYVIEAHAGGALRADLNIDQATEWLVRVLCSVAVFRPGLSFRIDQPDELTEFITAHVIRGLD